jgi:fatty-acyl-CoA synthase
MPIRTPADVVAVEQIPVWERIREQNIYESLRNVAEQHADQVALRAILTTDPNEAPRTVTFGTLLKRVTQAANLMTRLGLGPTDAVGLLIPLFPESFFALFGAMTAGVASPVNPLLEPGHLISILRQAGARLLVAPARELSPEIWAKVEAVRAELPELKAVLRLGGPSSQQTRPEPGVIDFASALADQPDDHLIGDRSISRGELAALFHTGGTTGQPKLARHTHGGLLVCAFTNGSAMSDGPGQVAMGGLPLFHIGGAIITGLSWLLRGNTAVLPTPMGLRNPNVIREYWRLCERLRPDLVGAVPTSLGALLDVPESNADRSTVRHCLTGASALPIEVARRFTQRFGVPVIEGYGMTEVHGYSTLNPLHGEVRLGSVGFRVPYMELRIADVSADGTIVRTCAPGEIGHVLMRGPQVFDGYQDPRNNRGTLLADGWLDSGDLGRLDEDGYLWLTGRSKELIIRGGHNIDPQIVEQVLYTHPAVALAAAVPAPDIYAGELPVAFVQLRPGKQAEAAELLSYCRERIAERAAVPVELYIDMPLPLTGMGKIFKPALRLEAARRVFARRSAQLKQAGIEARVDVEAHPVHGSLVRIYIVSSSALAPAEVDEHCKALFGGYPIHHEVVHKSMAS